MFTLEFGRVMADFYISEENTPLIVYLHASPESGAEVWQKLSTPKPVLAVVYGTDWNRDFSPWPAPKVFPDGDNFSGGGEVWLEQLADSILPAIEGTLPHPPVFRAIAGYSLAGLFALWCTYKCDMFDYAAAISPSLWFDGFLEFMDSHTPSKQLQGVVMSLGNREKLTRNRRMACIETAVTTAADKLNNSGIPVNLYFNPGGHFTDTDLRVAHGIDSLRAFLR